MAAPPIDPKLLGELAVVIIKAVSSQTSREQVGLSCTNVLTFPLPHLTVDVCFSSLWTHSVPRKTCQIEAR